MQFIVGLVISETQRIGFSKGAWAAIILGITACVITTVAICTLFAVRRRAGYQHTLSRKHLCKFYDFSLYDLMYLFYP